MVSTDVARFAGHVANHAAPRVSPSGESPRLSWCRLHEAGGRYRGCYFPLRLAAHVSAPSSRRSGDIAHRVSPVRKFIVLLLMIAVAPASASVAGRCRRL